MYQLCIVAVERDPEAVAQVFPEVGTHFPTSQNLVVTGILRKPTAMVRVKIGLSNGAVIKTIDIPLKSGEGASTLAARAWAVAKIEQLTTAPGDNREDIRRTSREFRIVTPDTSLIVLETLEDYLRYDIEPPAEDARLRDAWLSRRRATDDAFSKNREQQIDRIARQFNERVKWWERDFLKGASKMVPETPLQALSIGRPDGGTMAIPKGPATAPARPAARPAPASSIARVHEDGTVEMERYEVNATMDQGYMAMNSVSGARMETPLRDVAASISPFTQEYLEDVGPEAATRLMAEYERTGKIPSSSSVNSSFVAPQPAIALQRWSPSASYLDRLRRAPESERFAIYLEERADHAREPGFYLDVAGYFFDEAKDSATALQIMSNLAELGLENAALLRVLGHRLAQAERPDLALPVFERVLKIRGEEPQSRRDLALVCAKLGQHQRAVDLLWEVVSRKWDARFPEIEMIALGELNAIVATCGEKLDVSKIDSRLLKNLTAGLRVVLTWDADNCDIDLWVDDPNGERAMYNHPLTYQGGRMSKDFTGGYGPEEFLLREPKPGKYTARINYYGDSRQTALGPVTAQVRLITGFGTPHEKEKLITVRLVDKKESLEIGSIEIGK